MDGPRERPRRISALLRRASPSHWRRSDDSDSDDAASIRSGRSGRSALSNVSARSGRSVRDLLGSLKPRSRRGSAVSTASQGSFVVRNVVRDPGGVRAPSPGGSALAVPQGGPGGGTGYGSALGVPPGGPGGGIGYGMGASSAPAPAPAPAPATSPPRSASPALHQAPRTPPAASRAASPGPSIQANAFKRKSFTPSPTPSPSASPAGSPAYAARPLSPAAAVPLDSRPTTPAAHAAPTTTFMSPNRRPVSGGQQDAPLSPVGGTAELPLRSGPMSVFAGRAAARAASPSRRPLPLAPGPPGSPASVQASSLPRAASPALPQTSRTQQDGVARYQLDDRPPSVNDQMIARYALEDQPLPVPNLTSANSSSHPSHHPAQRSAPKWPAHLDNDNMSETTLGSVSTADADVTGRVRTPASQLAGAWMNLWGGSSAEQGAREPPQNEITPDPLRRLEKHLRSSDETRIAHVPESPVHVQSSTGLQHVKSQRVVPSAVDQSQWPEDEDDLETEDSWLSQTAEERTFAPTKQVQRESTPPPVASRTPSPSKGHMPGTPNNAYRATSPMPQPAEGQAMRSLTPVGPSPGRVVSAESAATAQEPKVGAAAAHSRNASGALSGAPSALTARTAQNPAQGNALTPGSGPLPHVTGWQDPHLPQALDDMMARFYRFERYAVPLLRELKMRVVDVEKDAQMSFAAAQRRRNGGSGTVRSEASGTSVSTTGSTEMDMWVEQMTRLMKHEIGQLGRATDELTAARCALEEIRQTTERGVPADEPPTTPLKVRSPTRPQQEVRQETRASPFPSRREVVSVAPESAPTLKPDTVSVSPTGRPRFTSALGTPSLGTPVLGSVPFAGEAPGPAPTTPRKDYPSRGASPSPAPVLTSMGRPMPPRRLHAASEGPDTTPRRSVKQLRPPTPEEEEDQSASALLRNALAEARTLSQLEAEAVLGRTQQMHPAREAELSYSLEALTDGASVYSQHSGAGTEAAGTEVGTDMATHGHSVHQSAPPSSRGSTHPSSEGQHTNVGTTIATHGHSVHQSDHGGSRTSLIDNEDDWSIEADLAEELGIPTHSPVPGTRALSPGHDDARPWTRPAPPRAGATTPLNLDKKPSLTMPSSNSPHSTVPAAPKFGRALPGMQEGAPALRATATPPRTGWKSSAGPKTPVENHTTPRRTPLGPTQPLSTPRRPASSANAASKKASSLAARVAFFEQQHD